MCHRCCCPQVASELCFRLHLLHIVLINVIISWDMSVYNIVTAINIVSIHRSDGFETVEESDSEWWRESGEKFIGGPTRARNARNARVDHIKP